jgi:hypothetical protein
MRKTKESRGENWRGYLDSEWCLRGHCRFCMGTMNC